MCSRLIILISHLVTPVILITPVSLSTSVLLATPASLIAPVILLISSVPSDCMLHMPGALFLDKICNIACYGVITCFKPDGLNHGVVIIVFITIVILNHQDFHIIASILGVMGSFIPYCVTMGYVVEEELKERSKTCTTVVFAIPIRVPATV